MDRALYRRLSNYLFVGLTAIATLIALTALVLILWSLLSKGLGGIDAKIFTMTQPAPGSEGGLASLHVSFGFALVGAIVGEFLGAREGMGLLIAVVIGVLAGTWLSEYGGSSPYGAAVRFLNDVLLSAPSILIGLFVYEIMVRPFQGFSAIAGAVALAIIAMPIVTRTTEDILSLQPSALREAGMALGASRAFVIRKVVWKSARAGLITGALLGFARISGETAPLLFTALGNQFFSVDPTQPMASLPTTIFQFALSAYEDWQRLAWVGALLIAVAVLSINIIGRVVAREARR